MFSPLPVHDVGCGVGHWGRVLGRAIDKPGDSLEIRRRTGFVSEDKGLYDYMTVGQTLDFVRPSYSQGAYRFLNKPFKRPAPRSAIERYLLPELNLRLRPKILDMKPGTRVVSHAFAASAGRAGPRTRPRRAPSRREIDDRGTGLQP